MSDRLPDPGPPSAARSDPAEVERAWREDIERRLAEVDAGTAERIRAEDIFAEFRARGRRRPHPEMYEIEIVGRSAPVPYRSWVSTVDEAYAAVEAAPGDACFVLVADHRGDLGHSEFLAWIADDRAYVRLDEHREHYATDPLLDASDTREVQLTDEDGSTFEVPFSETVSRTQALAALRHWLDSEGKWSTLSWD